MNRADRLTEGLTAFLVDRLGVDAAPEVTEVALISSVGNARDPWSFTATWRSPEGNEHRERCVMLLQAEAGQLETALGPEFNAVAALEDSGVPVARALWCDETGDWLGQPFFVTAFVPGTAAMRPLRVEGGVPEIRSVALDLARAAARLHNFDWSQTSLVDLGVVTPEGAALAQLAQWEEQFDRQRLEPHPSLAYAFSWLRSNAPIASHISVVHGDLRFGNLLYDDDRLTALVDWEMVHLGDPVEDLGWVYRRIWTPERSLPFEEFLAAYEHEAARPVDRETLRWYQAFSEAKHAMISLTAARSFFERSTLNLRHADRAETLPAFLDRFYELIAQ